MAIKSNINQYQGVNPHLQSRLQTPGTRENPSMWRAFHGQYIVNITEFMNAHLPEGYLAINEQSLQVLGEPEGGRPVKHAPIPDISIYGGAPVSSGTQVAVAVPPTWQAALEETINPDDIPDAVMIYAVTGASELGDPVTRIELLSRSNKVGGANVGLYNASRTLALRSGTALIELDYLHESLSLTRGLPAYPRHPDAHAYTIAISDPRPSIGEGTVSVYGFDLDQPIPLVPVPLRDDETLVFDFGEVYHYSYGRGPWGKIVDYAVEPARLDTYSEADRERIRARMAAIKAAHESGADLDAGLVVIEGSQS